MTIQSALLELQSIQISHRKHEKSTHLLFNDVVEKVCDFFGMRKDEALRKNRKKEFVCVRQFICFFGYLYTGKTLTYIAEQLDKDHTTIIHSRDTVFEKITSVFDDEYKDYHKELCNLLDISSSIEDVRIAIDKVTLRGGHIGKNTKPKKYVPINKHIVTIQSKVEPQPLKIDRKSFTTYSNKKSLYPQLN